MVDLIMSNIIISIDCSLSMNEMNANLLVKNINQFIEKNQDKKINVSIFNSVVGNRILPEGEIFVQDFSFIGSSPIYASIFDNLKRLDHNDKNIFYIFISDGLGNEPDNAEIKQKVEKLLAKHQIHFINIGHLETLGNFYDSYFYLNDLEEINQPNALEETFTNISDLINNY